MLAKDMDHERLPSGVAIRLDSQIAFSDILDVVCCFVYLLRIYDLYDSGVCVFIIFVPKACQASERGTLQKCPRRAQQVYKHSAQRGSYEFTTSAQ